MLRTDKRNWNLFRIYCIKKIVKYYRSNLEKMCSEGFSEKASHYHEIIRLFFYYLFRKYARKQVDRLLETRQV
jgi:hypothetical protein